MKNFHTISHSGRKKTLLRTFLASATLFFGGMKASAETTEKQSAPTPIVATTDAKQLGRDLYDYAESLLTLNEGKRLSFYRCSSKKASVGIGCNLQDFPNIAKDLNIAIFKKIGKQTRCLNPMQRDIFFANLAHLSTKELAQYCISGQDATSLSRETYAHLYDRLIQRFSRPNYAYISQAKKTVKTKNILAGVDIKQVPTLLQIAIMDTLYQLGETKFRKYHLFETALREGRYEDAFNELRVNCTNATQKKYKDKGSTRRGFRKDFLLAAYQLQQTYLEQPEAYYNLAETFTFDLVKQSRLLSKEGGYRSVINDTERKAAFNTILPFIMNMYHPDMTAKDYQTRTKELQAFWSRIDSLFAAHEKKQAAAKKVAETSPKKSKTASPVQKTPTKSVKQTTTRT